MTLPNKKAILYVSTLIVISLGWTHAEEIDIVPRTKVLQNFPCMECHDLIQSPERKIPLKSPHQNIKFNHMKAIQNCYICHDAKNMNQLKMITHETLSLNQSHQLCLQCHGEKTKDWHNGIHGKQVGSWNGAKFRSTCVECHDPHHPKFPQMQADPQPTHPKFLIPKESLTKHHGKK